MARSAGESPRSEAAQSRRRAVERATWKTGHCAVSKGVVPSSALAEKAVALIMATGGFAVRWAASQSATPGALRLGAKTPVAA
jgi:hypothetical protein